MNYTTIAGILPRFKDLRTFFRVSIIFAFPGIFLVPLASYGQSAIIWPCWSLLNETPWNFSRLHKLSNYWGSLGINPKNYLTHYMEKMSIVHIFNFPIIRGPFHFSLSAAVCMFLPLVSINFSAHNGIFVMQETSFIFLWHTCMARPLLLFVAADVVVAVRVSERNSFVCDHRCCW